MSQGFNFLVRNNTSKTIMITINHTNNNCMDKDYITPKPFIGAQFLIEPNAEFYSHLYRKDGHGCDGCQGVFQAAPVFFKDSDAIQKSYQNFSFDSHGSIGVTNHPEDYSSVLKQESGAGTNAIWTISESPNHL